MVLPVLCSTIGPYSHNGTASRQRARRVCGLTRRSDVIARRSGTAILPLQPLSLARLLPLVPVLAVVLRRGARTVTIHLVALAIAVVARVGGLIRLRRRGRVVTVRVAVPVGLASGDAVGRRRVVGIRVVVVVIIVVVEGQGGRLVL